MKRLTFVDRLLGGLLMTVVGLLYLVFEKVIISPPQDRSNAAAGLDAASKGIVVLQIGLVVLSMIVTRSSVSSLQAKRGLPFGNQVVGWIILGKPNVYVFFQKC